MIKSEISNYAVGVDIGGSHISSAVIDLKNETILQGTLSEREVDNSAEANEIINMWAMTISESVQKGNLPIKGIGIAMPGPFDYANGISLINGVQKFENLYGLNIEEALQLSLNLKLPIRFMNDASAFAVGEAFSGSGKGLTKMIAITLGTGFGSAFLENGLPIIDREDVPEIGCFYHLPYNGGIADEFFSTRWFLTRYKELTGKELIGVKDLVELVDSDYVVKKLFDEFGVDLALFLLPWLNKFQPEVLVIGGNIAKAWHLFKTPFLQTLEKENLNIVIEISKLKENAALLGSANLLVDEYWKEMQQIVEMM